jgi:5-methylcytosine-specific restriction protein A
MSGRPAWQGSTRAARLPGNWARLRRIVLCRDKYICQVELDCCTTRATEVDHIRPRDDHSPANLRAACHACNQRRNIETRPRKPTLTRPTEAHPGLTS